MVVGLFRRADRRAVAGDAVWTRVDLADGVTVDVVKMAAAEAIVVLAGVRGVHTGTAVERDKGDPARTGMAEGEASRRRFAAGG